jgi:hypothetical protein
VDKVMEILSKERDPQAANKALSTVRLNSLPWPSPGAQPICRRFGWSECVPWVECVSVSRRR